jgi:ribonuclease P protein component
VVFLQLRGVNRLRRSDRLLKAKDFQRVARRGVRVSSASFAMLVAPLQTVESDRACGSRCRIGITTSRRVGSAVVRNRVRRAVREWFRRDGRAFEEDVDVVVIARSAAASLGVTETAAELASLREESESATRRRSRA